VIARRIGRHVVLQGDGDIDQFARHGVSSLLFFGGLRWPLSRPCRPILGIELPQFCRKPVGRATNHPQPRCDGRTMSAIRHPGSGFNEEFFDPPGGFCRKRINLHGTLLILLNTPFA